ncbi:MAG TPA: YfdX family protein [Alphaproteobacteria bacterium]
MKNTHLLLATTFLATSLFVSPIFNAHAEMETKKTRVVSEQVTRTVKPLAINNETNEVKPAVQRFVELVNQARVDISMKKPQDAKPRLDNALKLAKFIRQNSTVQEKYTQTRISSGKVTYTAQDTNGTYYVPFETGPVKVTSVGSTSSSKSNPGVAVTGADVVYLTVNLAGPEAEDYIGNAKAALAQGDLKTADKSLATLMEKVAKTETAETLPYDKAKDNLALALRFLQDENYTASRYALSHAADAVKSMKGDSRYDSALIDKNYSRIKQIHDLVMQENRESAQKARTQIIAAQGEIKDLRS